MTRFTTALPALALFLLLSGCGSDGSSIPPSLESAALGFVPLAEHIDDAVDGPTTLAPLAASPPIDRRAGDPPIDRRAGDPPPDQIRGLYLTAYAAGDPARLDELLDLAARTEVNAFVIDVKTERGVHFASASEIAVETRRPGDVALADLPALLDRLDTAGIYSIARIVTFKDPQLVEARPEWAIRKPDGGVWIDREGNRWVSPWDDRVWDYNLDIAEEVAAAGFDEIQFDYVRFPEAYASLPRQVHPREDGDRTDAIARFLTTARERLASYDVAIAADVFGMSMNGVDDVGIGQQWERLATVVDHILPMVYPSHYFSTHLPGIERPNRVPRQTILTAVGMGVIRHDRLRAAGATPARIIPWLQAFDATWVDRDFPYGVPQVRAQIEAVYEVGLEDWILWDPSVRYERLAGAFESSTQRRAKPYDPPPSLVNRMDRYEGWGMAESRARAVEGLAGVAVP